MAPIRSTDNARPQRRRSMDMPSFAGTPTGAVDIGQVKLPKQPDAQQLPRNPTFSGPPTMPEYSGSPRAAASDRQALQARSAYTALSRGLAGNSPLLRNIGRAGMYGTGIPGAAGTVANALVTGVAAPLASSAVNRLGLTYPQRSYEYQRAKLLGEGWYTPSAQAGMQSVGVVNDQNIPGRAQYYDRENKIAYPKNYWANEPEYKMQEDMRHEFGHYFDVGPSGGRFSSNPQFVSAAKQTDAEFFPGMGLKPGIGARTGGFLGIGDTPGWGGPAEAYAYAGQSPYWFRKLSQWYPQYTREAYRMPAFAGNPNNPTNIERTGGMYYFEPTAGRGPYTDIANKIPGKFVSAPTEPLYYSYQR